MDLASAALDAQGISYKIVGDKTLFEIVFTDTKPLNYRDVFTSKMNVGAKFNAVLMENGLFKSPGKTYPCLALTEQDFELAEAAYEKAAAAIADM
jgi:glutamate-1-semialdehyde 2,1-aminomutase